MDALTAALAKVIEVMFTRPENIALLVSVGANVALGWFIIVSRREERVDQQAITTALTGIHEMLSRIRIVIAASLGKGDI
jgi:hypothetical protein